MFVSELLFSRGIENARAEKFRVGKARRPLLARLTWCWTLGSGFDLLVQPYTAKIAPAYQKSPCFRNDPVGTTLMKALFQALSTQQAGLWWNVLSTCRATKCRCRRNDAKLCETRADYWRQRSQLASHADQAARRPQRGAPSAAADFPLSIRSGDLSSFSRLSAVIDPPLQRVADARCPSCPFEMFAAGVSASAYVRYVGPYGNPPRPINARSHEPAAAPPRHKVTSKRPKKPRIRKPRLAFVGRPLGLRRPSESPRTAPSGCTVFNEPYPDKVSACAAGVSEFLAAKPSSGRSAVEWESNGDVILTVTHQLNRWWCHARPRAL